MKYYIVFFVYYYGEQGWDCSACMVTSDLEKAVNEANEMLIDMRNNDSYKYDRNQFGVVIQPVIDGESIEMPLYDDNTHNCEADGDKLFSVEDFN